MANSYLTVKLVDSTTVVYTLPVAAWPDAKTFAQNIAVTKGFWDDAGVWHPVSSIVSVTVTG